MQSLHVIHSVPFWCIFCSLGDRVTLGWIVPDPGYSASKEDGVTFGDTCVQLTGTNRRKRTMIRSANPLARRARNSRSDRCGYCLRDADRGSDLMRGYSRLRP